MDHLLFLVFIFLITFVLVIIFVIFLFKRRRFKRRQKYKTDPPPLHSYSFQKLNSLDKIKSNSWNIKMYDIVSSFSNHHVTHIFLVHGTFVGKDPFDIINSLKQVLPKSNHNFLKKLEFLNRKQQSRLIGDLGNFDEKYVSYLKDVFGDSLQIHEYNWSGANHHLARLMGARDLLCFIYKYINQKAPNRILLMGHSHAGQIFALVSQLLQGRSNNQVFFDIFDSRTDHPHNFEDYIKKINNSKIDIVTMGTPPRYHFVEKQNISILHLINHRGTQPFAGTLTKALNTTDGDYIQQLGIAGSDGLSMLKEDRKTNHSLDEILGTGMNIKEWKENIKFKVRVHDSGHNLLIDYEDNSPVPNFLKTLFGHGVYTKHDLILFNFNIIAKKLYNKK